MHLQSVSNARKPVLKANNAKCNHCEQVGYFEMCCKKAEKFPQKQHFTPKKASWQAQQKMKDANNRTPKITFNQLLIIKTRDSLQIAQTMARQRGTPKGDAQGLKYPPSNVI